MLGLTFAHCIVGLSCLFVVWNINRPLNLCQNRGAEATRVKAEALQAERGDFVV